ncbi:uncharacterized protein Z519_02595 [Cladophialophora bantiana CBS 173.52]|uniref:Wbp11/ELF5/Saf1 N-terminal domain-containing protein n=1 Tax=Cladophialophora bantiana (strain ATCC 10958 / CBS 173.52 / CDC B-1940 / NIH 8579) TaxID=1442370 RepID=A0A0D2HV09_CLAB1|nr:uncharacterized protein Z519_02595 [Cladophialophora bantiana CBS 173.52]KIW97203.1 hypothetical protein Z519_02595 [Cladophialophora bantiana CBS 173.52]
MAKDKERSVNPAQQQRRLEKAKQLKKSRAELQARRNEKLARRNPERIQRQIDDLKALEATGDIKPRERAILEDLERDLRAVKKAREALGDKAPTFGGQPRRRDGEDNTTVLGKRRHDGQRKHQHRQESSGSDTDESVRRIPMPEDTPPPIPREYRRYFPRMEDGGNAQQPTASSRQLPVKPVATPIAVKTTYESAPQIRDLRKEAVNRFVPDVVRKKQETARGGPTGRLIEPEEMDRLEAEGYLGRTNDGRTQTVTTATTTTTTTTATGDMNEDENARRLAEEEERFLREVAMQDQEANGAEAERAPEAMYEERRPRETPESQRIPRRYVEIEEVEDEDA